VLRPGPTKSSRVRLTRWLVYSLLLLLLPTGCSTFNRDWRDAARISSPPGDLAGRWQGSWISEGNGHRGKLRCLITKQQQDIYQARFHARYLKILSFGYTVSLEAKRAGNVFTFTGSAGLGSLGGVYHYDGHSEGTNFFSKYSSKYDHGTFQMRKL